MASQQTRRRATDTYTQRLQDTDAKVTEFIQQAINETTRAHKISVDSLFIGYLAAIFILVTGLVLTVLSINNLGLFTIAIFFVAIGGIWIISLQNRNLSKSNRSLVNNLAKLNTNLILLCKNILQPIRNHFKIPVSISSGYRSAELCEAIGSSPNSQHTRGEAQTLNCLVYIIKKLVIGS